MVLAVLCWRRFFRDRIAISEALEKWLDSLKIPPSGLSVKPTGSNQSNGHLRPSPSLQQCHRTLQSMPPLPSPVLLPYPLFPTSDSISIAGHSLNRAFALGPSAFPPVTAAGGPSLHQTLSAHHAGASPEKTITARKRPPLKHTFHPPAGPLTRILPTLTPS